VRYPVCVWSTFSPQYGSMQPSNFNKERHYTQDIPLTPLHRALHGRSVFLKHVASKHRRVVALSADIAFGFGPHPYYPTRAARRDATLRKSDNLSYIPSCLASAGRVALSIEFICVTVETCAATVPSIMCMGGLCVSQAAMSPPVRSFTAHFPISSGQRSILVLAIAGPSCPCIWADASMSVVPSYRNASNAPRSPFVNHMKPRIMPWYSWSLSCHRIVGIFCIVLESSFRRLVLRG